MSEPDLTIPLSFLMSASDASLENFEMKRREYAANIEKELRAMQREARKHEVAADVAAWLRLNRAEILRKSGAHLERVNREENAA